MIDYTYFKENHNICKNDIMNEIDAIMQKIVKNMETSVYHSKVYYETLFNLIDKFKKKLSETILMEPLNEGWCYNWNVSYNGVEMQLEHYTLSENYQEYVDYEEPDTSFILFSVNTDLLTVEEYSLLYEVEVVTVRQWIRRGKVRTAKKLGKEWRIPSLTDVPRRGYSSAMYEWDVFLENLPEDFEFINDYKSATFTQDMDDKKIFYITFWKTMDNSSISTAEKKIRCTVNEREKIELILISHPDVRYREQYWENIGIDLTPTFSTLEECEKYMLENSNY